MVISFPESSSYSSGNAEGISSFVCRAYLWLLRLIWPQHIYLRLASHWNCSLETTAIPFFHYRLQYHICLQEVLTSTLTTWTGVVKCLNVFLHTACHFISVTYELFQSRNSYLQATLIFVRRSLRCKKKERVMWWSPPSVYLSLFLYVTYFQWLNRFTTDFHEIRHRTFGASINFVKICSVTFVLKGVWISDRDLYISWPIWPKFGTDDMCGMTLHRFFGRSINILSK
jgi:hypothetical protein